VHDGGAEVPGEVHREVAGDEIAGEAEEQGQEG
jgi:hypothetical protein